LLHKEEQIKETILKTEALQEKLPTKRIKRADTQNRNTTSRETAQEKNDTQETILKTNQIPRENAHKELKRETIRKNTFRESAPQRTDTQRSNFKVELIF
jgi:hypothetical protein